MIKLQFFFFLFLTNSYANTTMRFCFLQSGFGDYTTHEGNGIWQERIKKILDDNKINYIFYYAPRSRCLHDLKTNTGHALIAAPTPERMKYMSYPRDKNGHLDEGAILDEVFYMLYKRIGPKINWDGKKLTGQGPKKVLYQRGLQIAWDLQQKKIDSIQGVETIHQILQMLELGRSEAAIIPKSQLSKLIKIPKNISEDPTPVLITKIYLAFAQDFAQSNSDTVEKIWKLYERKIKTLNKVSSQKNWHFLFVKLRRIQQNKGLFTFLI